MLNRVLIGLTILWAASGLAQPTLLLSEHYPPFLQLDEKGDPEGFGVALVRQLFADANLEIQRNKVYVYPWARTIQTLQETPNAAAFMTVRNEQREAMFKWVGPLAPREMWLFKLRERTDISANNLEEAKGYRVGGYRSSYQTEYLRELGFENIQVVVHEEQNLMMLLAQRVDIIPSLEWTIASRLQEMGLPYQHVEKVAVLDKRYDYYLAMNLHTPDATVERLQEALDKMKSDGRYQSLTEQYLKK